MRDDQGATRLPALLALAAACLGSATVVRCGVEVRGCPVVSVETQKLVRVVDPAAALGVVALADRGGENRTARYRGALAHPRHAPAHRPLHPRVRPEQVDSGWCTPHAYQAPIHSQSSRAFEGDCSGWRAAPVTMARAIRMRSLA